MLFSVLFVCLIAEVIPNLFVPWLVRAQRDIAELWVIDGTRCGLCLHRDADVRPRRLFAKVELCTELVGRKHDQGVTIGEFLNRDGALCQRCHWLIRRMGRDRKDVVEALFLSPLHFSQASPRFVTRLKSNPLCKFASNSPVGTLLAWTS